MSEQDANRRDMNVRIIEFTTVYKTDSKTGQYQRDEKGELIPVDYCDWSPAGFGKYTINHERIVDIQRSTDGRWDVIGPRYEAWKSGQAYDDGGTALEVWGALTPEQLKVLRSNDVRSIEDLAFLTDVHLTKIGLPGMREIQRRAKAYIDAGDSRKVEAEMAAMRQQNEDLRSQMAELMANYRSAQGQPAEIEVDTIEPPVKRKPGRPSKVDMEAA